MEFSDLRYDCTNERIDSVVNALSPQKDDHILAICGSGDIPFALLEYARVTAVDIDEDQVDFARYRADQLKQGDHAGFLIHGKELDYREYITRDKYFSENSKMEAIRERLEYLSFEVGNIFRMDIKDRGFNKIYLSNALSYRDITPNFVSNWFFRNVSENLLSPGLIYLTNYHQLLKRYKEDVKRMRLDFGLTRTASKYYDGNNTYNWRPAVLRLPRNNAERLICILNRIFRYDIFN